MPIRTRGERGSDEPRDCDRALHRRPGWDGCDRRRQGSRPEGNSFQGREPQFDYRGVGLRELPYPGELEDDRGKDGRGLRSLPNRLSAHRPTRFSGLQSMSQRRAARDPGVRQLSPRPASVEVEPTVRQLPFVQTMERHGAVRDSSADALPTDRHARARRLHRVPSAQRRKAVDHGSERLLLLPCLGLSRPERSSEPPRNCHVAAVPPGLLPVPRRERLEPRVRRSHRHRKRIDRRCPRGAGRNGDPSQSRQAFSGFPWAAPRGSMQYLPHLRSHASTGPLHGMPCPQSDQAAAAARAARL